MSDEENGSEGQFVVPGEEPELSGDEDRVELGPDEHVEELATEELEPELAGGNGEGSEEQKEKVLAFLGDEPPRGKTDLAKWLLLRGSTEEQLVANGHNPGTVRIAAYELERDGYRQRPPKIKDVGGKALQGMDAPGVLQVYAKGSPIEALIEHYARLPDIENGRSVVFGDGMKFGLSLAVLGIRMAQELSGIGIQQAKPLLEMAKSMREGEAAAAKNAAGEAAMEAAGMVAQQMAPTLNQLAKRGEPTGGDPMRAMVARIFEPMLQNMVGQMMPGMGGQTNQPTQGWIHRQE